MRLDYRGVISAAWWATKRTFEACFPASLRLAHPSRRPLRGLLRAWTEMSRFKHLPHPEERCEAARLEGWQQARCSFPPFETHRCAMLLRVRLHRDHRRRALRPFVNHCFDCIHFESDSQD